MGNTIRRFTDVEGNYKEEEKSERMIAGQNSLKAYLEKHGDNRSGDFPLCVIYTTGDSPCGSVKIPSEDHTSKKTLFGGPFNNFVIDESNRVYGWGLNDSGQLGLGYVHYSYEIEARESDFVTELPLEIHVKKFINHEGLPPVNIGIDKVASGERHTLFLMSDGTVYASGRSNEGQLGFMISPEELKASRDFHESIMGRIKNPPKAVDELLSAKCQLMPKEISGITSVKNIKCGKDFSVLLTAAGELFTFGGNMEGQLGLDNLSSYIPTPTKVNIIGRVAYFDVGWIHCLASVENGAVYEWGSMDPEERPLQRVYRAPSRVSEFDNLYVSHLACGYHHNIVVVKGAGGVHEIHGWGCNDSGQLGVGKDAERLKEHAKYFNEEVKDDERDRGKETEEGDGDDNQVDEIESPALLWKMEDGNIRKVVAGCSHTLLLTTRGEVFGAGLNDVKQISEKLDSNEYSQFIPVKFPDTLSPFVVADAICGDSHTMYLFVNKKNFSMETVYQLEMPMTAGIVETKESRQ